MDTPNPQLSEKIISYAKSQSEFRVNDKISQELADHNINIDKECKEKNNSNLLICGGDATGFIKSENYDVGTYMLSKNDKSDKNITIRLKISKGK